MEKESFDFHKILPAIMDSMDTIMAVKDAEGRFIIMNKHLAHLAGTTPEALIGKTDFDFLPHEMSEKYRRDDLKVLENQRPMVFEDEFITKDGKRRSFMTHKKPIFFENSNEKYLFVFAMEITRQKETEKEARLNEDRYRMLFDTMVSGFVLCEVVLKEDKTPEDFIYLEINPAYEKMSLRKKEEYIGKRMRETFPYMEEYLSEAYEKAEKTGDAVEIERYSPRRNRYFSILAFIPEKGKFAFITTDITERKQMQEAIYTEKEYFRVTLQSLGDGVVTTDVHQRVQLMNTVAEKITGWTQQEAKGRPFLEVFDLKNENGSPVQNPVERALAAGTVTRMKKLAMLRAKDGTVRNVADSAAPIMDAKGRKCGAVMVFRDVTEKKRYDDNIRYLTYHDPLTGIYNRMYFEKEIKRIEKKLKRPVSVIMGDVNGLKLSNDLFGHARGDELLRIIARIIKDNCPEDALLARWGGDEFMICLSGLDKEGAEEIIERIHNACRLEKGKKPGQVIQPSISMGSATDMDGGEDIYRIIQKAENNMYKAKLLESRSIQGAIISSIRNMLFEQNVEEKEHGQRMVYYCQRMGEQLNIPKIKLEELELAAVMHDVGMIAISQNIILKPEGLSEDEWIEVRRHPEMGYRIARASAELAGIADYILYHHERWDGKGYPQGLKKDAIPLFSRILSVADAYDAMTHPRPYRRKLSPSEAMGEIERHSGTIFDPVVVEAMRASFSQKAFS